MTLPVKMTSPSLRDASIRSASMTIGEFERPGPDFWAVAPVAGLPSAGFASGAFVSAGLGAAGLGAGARGGVDWAPTPPVPPSQSAVTAATMASVRLLTDLPSRPGPGEQAEIGFATVLDHDPHVLRDDRLVLQHPHVEAAPGDRRPGPLDLDRMLGEEVALLVHP